MYLASQENVPPLLPLPKKVRIALIQTKMRSTTSLSSFFFASSTYIDKYDRESYSITSGIPISL